MLRVLGNPKTLCNGLTRRDLLTAGAALGLTLPAFLRAQAEPSRTSPDKHFGRAKSCILLFLYGSPSQLELADQKPDAPVEVRGELGSIRSTLPRLRRVRAAAAHQPRHAQRHGRAVGHAQAPDPRRRLRHHRGARHRRGDGTHPARRPALAVHRLGGRAPGTAQEPGLGPQAGAGQHRPAVPVQQPADGRGAPRRARTRRSSAAGTTRTSPRSTARRTAKITKTLAPNTQEFDEPYVGIEPNAYFTLGGETEPRTSRSTA